ncbi:MAG: hypothetical protein AAF517_25175, partial [Planctomycetota bacterium]
FVLALLGMGCTFYLWFDGKIEDLSLLLMLLIGWSIGGAASFFFFKFLGELAFLCADLGDRQNDVVQLLLDLRSVNDRLERRAGEEDREGSDGGVGPGTKTRAS